MKPNKFIIGGLFATTFTAFGGAAYASADWHPCDAGHMPGAHVAHMMGRGGFGDAPPQFRRLQLTQQQRNAIFNIKYKSLPSLRAHYQQLRETRIALRKAAADTHYDAAKIRGLADKLGKLQGEIAARRAEDQHKIFAVLTPQQQAQLEHMHEWRPMHGQQRDSVRGSEPGTPPDMGG